MPSSTASSNMRAVVFHAPYKITIEQRPVPEIQLPTDIVVKVAYTALCGSDLHIYRGHEASPGGYIMGHEFIGTVSKIGSEVESVQIGDKVVSPFTTSCLQCFYCSQQYSSRCSKGAVFGTPNLDGAQAEYVRVPLADGTVVKAPVGIEDTSLLLMGDVFPTGFFAAENGFRVLTAPQIINSVTVVIGCGPVGLCAIIAAKEKGGKHLIAVDSVPSRLKLAETLGAEPWNYLADRAGLKYRLLQLTDGRGADVVIEVVGLTPALEMGFEFLRPFGTISSVGVHNGSIPWSSSEAYGKNLNIFMGRCPVRSIFSEALELLEKKQKLLGFMFENIMPLTNAVKGYEIFEKNQVQKVVFKTFSEE